MGCINGLCNRRGYDTYEKDGPHPERYAPRYKDEMCFLMSVVVPKLEYATELWEENAKLVKKLETAHVTAATKYLDARQRQGKQP